QGPVIVISSVLGGGIVAVFSVSRTLSSLSRQAIDALGWAFWPEVARAESGSGSASLRLLHKSLVATSIVVSTMFATGFWYEGGGLIALWTRDRLATDDSLLQALLALAVLQAPW